MKSKFSTSILFIICLTIASFTLSQDIYVESLGKPTDISGLWKYKIGDDQKWAAPYLDDSQWQEIPVPMNWKKFGLTNDFNYHWHSPIQWR